MNVSSVDYKDKQVRENELLRPLASSRTNLDRVKANGRALISTQIAEWTSNDLAAIARNVRSPLHVSSVG